MNHRSNFALIFWLDFGIITAFILFNENYAYKIQFYNPIVERTTQLKKFGLIINHAIYIFNFSPG